MFKDEKVRARKRAGRRPGPVKVSEMLLKDDNFEEEDTPFRKLVKLFFGPLAAKYLKGLKSGLSYEHEEKQLDVILNVIFDADNRKIVELEALEPFKMPGLLWRGRDDWSPMAGFRDVLTGDRITCRMDKRKSDEIRLQFDNGNIQQEFKLKIKDFESLEDKLKQV
jgi:hypothetical protein